MSPLIFVLKVRQNNDGRWWNKNIGNRLKKREETIIISKRVKKWRYK